MQGAGLDYTKATLENVIKGSRTLSKVSPGAAGVQTRQRHQSLPPGDLDLRWGVGNTQKHLKGTWNKQQLQGTRCGSSTQRKRKTPWLQGEESLSEPPNAGQISEGTRGRGGTFQAGVTAWAQVQRQENLSTAACPPPLKAQKGAQRQLRIQMVGDAPLTGAKSFLFLNPHFFYISF